MGNPLSARIKRFTVGTRVRIDACSLCQLRCPVCATWRLREQVGSGYLEFGNFKGFVDAHPYVTQIELSNDGEIFLNPHLGRIIEYAGQKGVRLYAYNGVNLNDADEGVLEALVKHKFRALNISIDGASEEVYRKYRVGGSFAKVMANIEKINILKGRYGSAYPRLTWQFIVFGHNEHELPLAKETAKRLGMGFYIKHNVDPSFSPPQDTALVKEHARHASVTEYEQEEKTLNDLRFCEQLWTEPQFNWDGRLLGCCCNSDFFPANVFTDGLEKALRSEEFVYAKKMVTGKAGPRKDIPCNACPKYQWRLAHKVFVDPLAVRTVKRAGAKARSLAACAARKMVEWL